MLPRAVLCALAFAALLPTLALPAPLPATLSCPFGQDSGLPLLLTGDWQYRPEPPAPGARDMQTPNREERLHPWKPFRLEERNSRPPAEVAEGEGRVWRFRHAFTLPAGIDTGRGLALYHLKQLMPMELYWDGRLIGKNGHPAPSPAAERLGSRYLYSIPPSLARPGPHTVEIRYSHENGVLSPLPAPPRLDYLDRLEAGIHLNPLFGVLLAGIFCFTALFRLSSTRAQARPLYTVLFAVSIFSCGIYILTDWFWWFEPLGPESALWNRILHNMAWYCMLSLVPDFYIFEIDFPYKKVAPAMLLVGLVCAGPLLLLETGVLPHAHISWVLVLNEIFTYVAIGISAFVILYAFRKKLPGSRIALVGIVLLYAGAIASWQWDILYSWAAGVAAHIVCLTFAQSRQLAFREERHQQDRLRAARLEIELLKKNIQPHFLLNSLNSIIAWLEEEPKTALRLVNALGDELRMLLEISSRKTIPLSQEVRLCEAHLQVMGLRQDKKYRLEIEDGGKEGADEPIPPMVLHTLVENGITHGYAGKDEGVFVLRREYEDDRLRIRLFNDSRLRERKQPPREGTGLRYVRTRLEEAFPGRWSLDSGPVEEGWEAVLEVKGLRREAA